MSTEIKSDIKGFERFLFTEGADPNKLHLHVSEIGPGTRSHPPHQHEGQEIFFVLEGEGEVMFGESTHQVNGGEAVHVNCEILHGIQNVGSGPLRYAVIIAK
ncbi:MAG: cupin domain-containing protein [bacterium]|nr:cupin domain-containing protein [bacterium]